ncbi:MAG TPA: MerR family transcriptional regulator [Solirubrobacterales bacterium]|nr:MerR family transcriptional regulator [Solirubrobacterales bacterium]
MDDDLISIGTFARLTRLTHKALRLYDSRGLLTPAFVDPESGYRYYARTQVATAAAIALLRSLDVSLDVIGQIIGSEDPARAQQLLEGERRRVTAEIERRRGALSTLERLLDSDPLRPYEVEATTEPERLLVALEGRVEAERLPDDVASLHRSLRREVAEQGWKVGDPTFGLYPLDLPDASHAVVALPVEADAGVPSERLLELPGGAALTTLHVGAYEELPLAYAAIFSHAADLELQPAAPVREQYLSDPDAVRPDELATRLTVCVEAADPEP